MNADPAWIWGRHPVLEALRADKVQRVLIAETAGRNGIVTEIADAAAGRRVPLQYVASTEIVARVGDVVAQGVIAELTESRPLSLEAMLELVKADPDWPPLLLVLDQVQDPHNVGSLIRTAEACGAHGVITTGRNSAPILGTVTKASAGAVNHIPVVTVPNLARSLTELSKHNIWTVALDESGDTPIYQVDLTAATAIIIGSEGKGVRRLTAERADIRASIPTRGQIASFNASVAGAIAMYEALRQRTQT